MSPADQGAPLRVGAVGLDERQCNAVRLVFDGACRKRYALTEPAAAEAWIVDLDHSGAVEALSAQWAEQGQRPAIFLTLSAAPEDVRVGDVTVQGVFLRKPFRVDEFVALLPQLATAARRPQPTLVEQPTPNHRIDSARVGRTIESSRAARLLVDEVARGFVGSAEDIDLANPLDFWQICYAPERYLQGLVAKAWQQACDSGKPVAVTGPWPTVVLLPEQNRVRLGAPARQFRPAAITPDLGGEIHEVASPPEVAAGEESLPYPAFLWKLALWAARGRIPEGTPVDVPVYLRRWPNFTRLDVPPSALSIAALWSREPHTLQRTIEVLHVPQRFVFGFYSATKAIALSGISQRTVDNMIKPSPLPAANARTGFLSRVLEKLRIGK